MNTQATDRSPVRHDDDDLKRLARRDRKAALTGVVHRYRARLLRHASGYVRDADIAADVVQDVFVKAMHERRLFETEFRIAAWLHRVTTNLCLNLVRDSRRRTEILADAPTRRSAEATQLDAIAETQRARQVDDALARLTPAHRQILRERFWADQSYQEIADVLDLELGTVMSRLSRAKDALEAVIDGALSVSVTT